MWHPIISWNELQARREFAFVLGTGSQLLEGFLVVYAEQPVAWKNSCPHRQLVLNWNPHQFLDQDGELIVCAMHGALFRPDDGLCIYGPCQGQALERLALSLVVNGNESGSNEAATEVAVWFAPPLAEPAHAKPI